MPGFGFNESSMSPSSGVLYEDPTGTQDGDTFPVTGQKGNVAIDCGAHKIERSSPSYLYWEGGFLPTSKVDMARTGVTDLDRINPTAYGLEWSGYYVTMEKSGLGWLYQ